MYMASAWSAVLSACSSASIAAGAVSSASAEVAAVPSAARASAVSASWTAGVATASAGPGDAVASASVDPCDLDPEADAAVAVITASAYALQKFLGRQLMLCLFLIREDFLTLDSAQPPKAGFNQVPRLVTRRIVMDCPAPKLRKSTAMASTPSSASTPVNSSVSQSGDCSEATTTKPLLRPCNKFRASPILAMRGVSPSGGEKWTMSHGSLSRRRPMNPSSWMKFCALLNVMSYGEASPPRQRKARDSSQEPAKTSRRTRGRKGFAQWLFVAAKRASPRGNCQRSSASSSATKTASLLGPCELATGGNWSWGHQPTILAFTLLPCVFASASSVSPLTTVGKKLTSSPTKECPSRRSSSKPSTHVSSPLSLRSDASIQSINSSPSRLLRPKESTLWRRPRGSNSVMQTRQTTPRTEASTMRPTN
mmetsp:Transcript_88581/g.190189  ORF Transcript_88581/g.190189 Transcript_88581/m.190189 type:complete len:424 (-) Transcript_88581:127-1398(-)